jgi:hypothetical protein
MKQFKALIIVGLFAALLFCQVTSQTQAKLSAQSSDNVTNTTLPFLHTKGDLIVNESGGKVCLRGVNIGIWLLIEPWIMGEDWKINCKL